ncbi:3-oxoadipate enol-lactonase [bacterium]|nr:3-oxoadipate enol-lactonase [bacterium]
MTFAYIKEKNVNIHYHWINSGKPKTYIFINALGTDLRIWDGVVDRLANHGNILRFDKQGHGLSSLDPNTKSLAQYMTDLVMLMSRLKITKCNLVGLSVGGMIAQLMSYNHPELIDKLILCDTRHKIGDANGWNSRIQQVEAGGVASIADSILQRWFSKDFHQTKPETVSGIKVMLERCSSAGYIQTCMAIRDADLTESTKKIKHKTLAIVGSEDGSTSVNDVKSMADIIPGSRLEIIEGSGHLPCVDNPEKLSTMLVEFS